MRELNFYHLYGSLKLHKSEYSEVLDDYGKEMLKEKIKNNKQSEILRTSEEIEIPTEFPDKLLDEGISDDSNDEEDSEEEYPPLFMHDHPAEEDIEQKYKRNMKKFAEQEELERLERGRFE